MYAHWFEFVFAGRGEGQVPVVEDGNAVAVLRAEREEFLRGRDRYAGGDHALALEISGGDFANINHIPRDDA